MDKILLVLDSIYNVGKNIETISKDLKLNKKTIFDILFYFFKYSNNVSCTYNGLPVDINYIELNKENYFHIDQNLIWQSKVKVFNKQSNILESKSYEEYRKQTSYEEILEQLIKAIDICEVIEIVTKDNKFKVIPIKILFNNSTGFEYLIYENYKINSFGKWGHINLRDIVKVNFKKIVKDRRYNIAQVDAYVKNYYEFDLSVMKNVKLLVFNDGSHAIEKVRNHLAYMGIFKEDLHGNIIFEGDVVGINSLKVLIRSLGSSIKVESPKELIEEIVQSNIKRLKQYKQIIEDNKCY